MDKIKYSPLVYRGEHGPVEPDQVGVHTRLGSITFSTLEAAREYAESPNDHRDAADFPRVIPAYLLMQSKFINQPDDPFLDIAVLRTRLGTAEARRIAVKFADWITQTDCWNEACGHVQEPAATYLASAPVEMLDRLYFNAYAFFDDSHEVEQLKALGYDSAIHCGSGVTALEPEYRVFSPGQVMPAIPERERMQPLASLSRSMESMGKSSVAQVRAAVMALTGSRSGALKDGLGKIVVTTSAEFRANLDFYPRLDVSVLASLVDEREAIHPQARARLAYRANPLRRRLIESRLEIRRVLRQIGTVGDGMVLKQKSAARWGMILPDASEPGKWRIQTFDERGFSGHSTYNTTSEALRAAVQSGFVERDDGALDKLQATPAFQRGNHYLAVISRVNAREITFAEGMREMDAYDTEHQLLRSLGGAHAQAFYDPQTGTIVLFADRIEAGQELGVVAHEIVHKHGRSVLKDIGFRGLLDTLRAWRDAEAGSNERRIHDVATAKAKVAAAHAPSVFDEELFAYAVEAAYAMGLRPRALASSESAEGWLAASVAVLKKALSVAVMQPDNANFTAQDLVDLSFALAQMERPERAREITSLLGQEHLEALRALEAVSSRPVVQSNALERWLESVEPSPKSARAWAASIEDLQQKGALPPGLTAVPRVLGWLGSRPRDQMIMPMALASVAADDQDSKSLSRIRRSPSAPFFSQLREALLHTPVFKQPMPAPAWKEWLVANHAKLRIKRAEIDWSELLEWLDLQGSERLSQGDVLSYLTGRLPSLMDVELESPDGRVQRLGDAVQAAAETFFRSTAVVWPITVAGHRVFSDELGYMLQDGDIELDQLPEPLRAPADDWLRAEAAYQDALKNPDARLKSRYDKFVVDLGVSRNAYKELLVTMPKPPYRAPGLTGQQDRLLRSVVQEPAGAAVAAGVADFLRDGLVRAGQGQSPHWTNDARNIVASLRMDEGVDAAGQRVLFVNEIQSDWGQKARTQGVLSVQAIRERFSQRVAALESLLLEARSILSLPGDFEDGLGPKETIQRVRDAGYPSLSLRIGDALNELVAVESDGLKVIDAPFIADTQAWVGVAVKRVFRYAAERGIDKIAFAKGEQVSKMFDLNWLVESVILDRVKKRVLVEQKKDDGTNKMHTISLHGLNDEEAEEKVGRWIGKGVAKRLFSEAGEQQHHMLRDLNSPTDTGRMSAFYDKIVPDVARATAKSVGAKVVDVLLKGAVGSSFGIELGPGVRDRLLQRGLPMFSQDTPMVEVAKLPDDMWEFISNQFDAHGLEMPVALPVRAIPTDAFPDAALPGPEDADDRGELHARLMMGQNVPPVVVNGQVWLDGRHRVWAARREGLLRVNAVDLSAWLPAQAPDRLQIGLIDSDKDDSLTAAVPARAAAMYSALARGVAGAPLALERVPASQWRGWILSNQSKFAIRSEELEATDVLAYLESQGDSLVSRAALLDHIQGKTIVIRDMVRDDLMAYQPDRMRFEDFVARLDGEWQGEYESVIDARHGMVSEALGVDSLPRDRFTQYPHKVVWPAGAYKELLILAPVDSELPFEDYLREYRQVFPKAVTSDDEVRKFWEEGHNLPKPGDRTSKNLSVYRGGHWDHPNVLAHVRFTEQTDPDGRTSLVIQEIQSDWAAAARKNGWVAGGDNPRGVANAPYVGETRAWVALALKRVIVYACERQIDLVRINNGQQMSDLFMGGLGDHGMKVFYDQIVPSVLKKLISGTSAKVMSYFVSPPAEVFDVSLREVETDKYVVSGRGLEFGAVAFLADTSRTNLVRTLQAAGRFDLETATALADTVRAEHQQEQVGFDITPDYRARILKRGFALYSVPNTVIRSDIPNNDWLQSQVRYAIEKGRNNFGVPYMGSCTGFLKSEVHVPLSVLTQLPGQRAEQSNVRPRDLDYLTNLMRDTGGLPLENGRPYKPFIQVAYNGEAWVNEGNHRIMAAAALGWTSLPVEIQYHDGGEFADGPLSPTKLQAMQAGLSDLQAEASEKPTHAPEKKAAMTTSENYLLPEVIFSRIRQVVARAPAKLDGQPAAQWIMWIQSNAAKLGIRQDDLQASDITGWLQSMASEPILRSDVDEFIRVHGSGIQVMRLIDKVDDVAYMSQLLAPLGFGCEFCPYEQQAMFFLLGEEDEPLEFDDLPVEVQNVITGHSDAVGMSGYTKYGDSRAAHLIQSSENYQEVLLHVPGLKGADGLPAFQGRHWDAPNVLVHLRTDEQVDSEGNRVLMVHEIQSDWGQSVQKQGLRDQTAVWTGEQSARLEKLSYMDPAELSPVEVSELADLKAQEMVAQKNSRLGIKSAYIGKTESWVGLAVRFAISEAVTRGLESVAFVPGHMAAKVFNLSTEAKAIEYTAHEDGSMSLVMQTVDGLVRRGFNLNRDDVLRTVGHGAFNLIEEKVNAAKIADKRKGDIKGSIEGDDFYKAGEGLRAFYDEIVPNIVSDVNRKLGGVELERRQIIPELSADFRVSREDGEYLVVNTADEECLAIAETEEAAKRAAIKRLYGSMPSHLVLTITPAMRQALIHQVKGEVRALPEKAVASPQQMETEEMVEERSMPWRSAA